MPDVPVGRKPLFVPLARDPYERFASGKKTVEVRQDAPRWADRHVYPGRLVRLRLGYGGNEELLRVITRVARGPEWHSLPSWARMGADIPLYSTAGPFFRHDKPLVAFECLRMDASNQALWANQAGQLCPTPWCDFDVGHPGDCRPVSDG